MILAAVSIILDKLESTLWSHKRTVYTTVRHRLPFCGVLRRFVLHFYTYSTCDSLHTEWFYLFNMKMPPYDKCLWTFANLVCTSFFFYQLSELLPTYFTPTMTYTEVKNVELKDMDFPLDFKICVSPLFNTTALGQFGYEHVAWYKMGVNSDGSLIGWGGHDNNFGAMANAEQLLKDVRNEVTSNIFNHVYIKPVNYKGNGKNITDKISLDRINWLEECLLLNLSRTMELLNGMQQLVIFVNKSDPLIRKNVTLELKLGGVTLATARELMDHRFYHSGPDMTLDICPLYVVKIKKNVFVEEDVSKNCRNYPNPDFSSYKECDIKYMRQKIDENFPGMVLNPPWLVEDLSNATTTPVESNGFHLDLHDMAYGLDTSDCPLPCTTVSTETRLASYLAEAKPGIALDFQQNVEVLK